MKLKELNKKNYEEICEIFYPNGINLPCKPKWELTKENVGKAIINETLPVHFGFEKTFKLFKYLKENKLVKEKVKAVHEK